LSINRGANQKTIGAKLKRENVKIREEEKESLSCAQYADFSWIRSFIFFRSCVREVNLV
jgi:hypothetical protein